MKRLSAFIRSFHFNRTWQCYLMLVPPAVIVAVFSYIPLYGLIIAFQDYDPTLGFASPLAGLKWFRVLWNMPDFFSIVQNTLFISLGKIFFGQLVSIFFAILLNELRHPLFKRSVQTVTYFPHFLSWVIIGGVFTDLLSGRGIINQLITLLGGASAFFLGNNQLFQPTMVTLHVWKEFGYGAIIYLAAITTINPDLYEAATIDGAGRFRQTLSITLPSIATTIAMMTVLNLGGIMNAGFEQIFVLYNPVVYETGDIIDTFIYRQGLIDAQYSLSTALGLFKSVIGAVLLIATNWFASRRLQYRIF